jgi:hypothetical protein
MQNDNGLGEGQSPAQQSFPSQSLAERIWENKWTWAVGRTWRQHILNLGVYVALITGLMARRQTPAAIFEKIGAHWSPCQQEIFGDAFALFVTLPGGLTTLYVMSRLIVHAMLQATDKISKVADYFGADVLKQFLDHVVKVDPERRILLDLTPQGGLLPIWVLFLFWPLTVYQWCLAGVFAAVALCLRGLHRFRGRE